MKLTTYEAVVENGQIKLADAVRLPEHTKVFVIVPLPGIPVRIASPRLVDSGQAAGFALEVVEEPTERDAEREVEVTIEPAEPKGQTSPEQREWRQFIQETAGAWQGDLVRPDQGRYEQRDELP